MTTFGERLRQLRRAAGLSQTELAGEELSSSYISLLEAGKRSPSDEVVQQLAVRLGCSTTQLVAGKPSERDERIRLELDFARLANEHGEAEAARDRLERLLTEDGLPQRVRDDVSFHLGIACDRSGDIPAAIRVFMPLFERALTGQTHLLINLLGLGLCGFYLETGDLIQAAQVGEAALAAAETQGLAGTDEYYRLAATVMNTYIQRGDNAHARAWAERMLERAQTEDRPAGQGAIYWNLALLAEQEGRLADARHLCEQALGRMSELDSTRDYARLRLELAIILLSDMPAQTDRAVEVLKLCVDELSDLGSRSDMAIWNWAMSVALLDQGDAAGAETRARQSLDLARGVPDLQADAWQALSDALAAQHRDDQAADALREAISAMGEVPSGRSTALTWRELGERLVRDDLKAAVEAFQHALDSAGVRDRGRSRRLQVAALRARPRISVPQSS